MKKRKTITTIFSIMFLAGLALLLYPFVANLWNTYRQLGLISEYDQEIAEMAASGLIDYKAEWAKAQAYNDALIPYILPDSFAEAEIANEEDAEYWDCLNVAGTGMMGYVEVPKINIKIPIFHTTTKEILQKGAGHLEGSSLPIGGENGHTVISAHRGLPSAALFTDLDKLEIGDYFFLHILDQDLCYQVDKISVVDPTDTSDLVEEENLDLATLLTCTPYGVNTQRLLVRGVRAEFDPQTMESMGSFFMGPSFHTSYLFWVLVGLAVTGVFIVLLYLYNRRPNARAASDTVSMEVSHNAAQDLSDYDIDVPDDSEFDWDDGPGGSGHKE